MTTPLECDGCMVVQCDAIVAADPAFVDQAGITLKPVQPGLWNIYVFRDEEEKEESCVRQLLVVHTDIRDSESASETITQEFLDSLDWNTCVCQSLPAATTDSQSGREEDSLASASSGQAGFFDAATVPGHPASLCLPEDPKNWFQRWYDAISTFADSSTGFGVTGGIKGPVGCVSNSGYGAGNYVPEVCYDNDVIVACRYTFIE